MKLRYLREVLEHTFCSVCDDYSCASLVADTDNNNTDTEMFQIPFSEFNIPFNLIEIDRGSIVVNIISDLGYEIIMASKKTGKQGKVIGIDFSPAMMYRAQFNVEKTGCENVFFREVFSSTFLPLGANIADTLIFNKLLNQFPNKNLFSEIYRILKPGGSFYIYDLVSDNPDCVEAGIKTKKNHIQKLNNYGFKDISIIKFLKNIPAGELIEHLNTNLDIGNLDTALISGKK
jgi:ubiquinone/menaquinone biosynthesis C-methylase UbiE